MPRRLQQACRAVVGCRRVSLAVHGVPPGTSSIATPGGIVIFRIGWPAVALGSGPEIPVRFKRRASR